jgi:hypothetical protein
MSRSYAALLAVSLLCPLSACDSDEETQPRAVENFTDGMAFDSDQGAFRVILWSDSGALEVGRNDLVLRIGFHDPNDPEAPGIGIPSAVVDLDAWMPDADETMPTEPQVSYLGDGEYRIENVVLPDDGVWNLDFAVAVGDNMRESISLGFMVE